MILNGKLFNQVVETAKAKCAGNAALLRGIDRAVVEINRSRYWAYDANTNVLRIQSTTSRKLYIVDDTHTCEATQNGHKHCKHIIARRLLQRYFETSGQPEVVAEKKIQRVQNWSSREGHTVQEFPRVTITPHPLNTKEQRRAYWAYIAALPHPDLDKRLPKRIA